MNNVFIMKYIFDNYDFNVKNKFGKIKLKLLF